MKHVILVVALAVASSAQHDATTIIQRSVGGQRGGLEGRS